MTINLIIIPGIHAVLVHVARLFWVLKLPSRSDQTILVGAPFP